MRYGVVNVQQVEPVALRHIRHARSESQAIRRVLEERIVRDLNLVIVDARQRGIEPDRDWNR